MTNMINTTNEYIENMEGIVRTSQESYETYYEVMVLLKRLMIRIEHMETSIIDKALHKNTSKE